MAVYAVVVILYRWAGLLTVCRRFFSIRRDKEGMKENLLPIPPALNFLCFLAINYAYLHLLQI